jgi:hypothetical protein
MTIIEEFAKAVVERAQFNLKVTRTIRGKKRNRYSSGNLHDSLTSTINYKARSTEVLFGASGSAKRYADIVEEGRRKGATPPPIAPIEQWIRTRKVRMRGASGGFVKQTPQAIRQAAFLISRAIGKNGIEGIHYMQEAIEEELEIRGEDFTNQLIKDLQIKIDTIVWQ